MNNGRWEGAIAQSGGELRGTGTIAGNVTITGGTFAPGSNSIGSKMTIEGHLTLGANAHYRITLDPTGSTSATVTGRAYLNGTFSATFNGVYVTKSYVVLTADGGVTGQFASFDKPANMTARLVYNQQNVTLQLTADAAGDSTSDKKDSLKTATMRPVGNQLSVARSIDRFFNTGGQLPSDFLSLYSLTGEALSNGLAQLSGEVNTGAQVTAFASMSRFMRLATDTMDQSRQRELVSDRVMIWTAALGGVEHITGDSKLGTGRYIGRTGGMVVGMDHILSADRAAGFALAGASGNWTVRSTGTGLIDSIQLVAYGRQSFGAFDVTATFGLGQHWFGVDRTSFLNKGVASDYTGQSIAGRFEATYRVMDSLRIVAAVEGQRFAAQAFAEKGGTDNKFLLSSGDQSGIQSRFEVGARYEDAFRLPNGMQVLIKTQASYIRNESSSPFVRSSFSSLEGTSFDIRGAKPSRDGIALSTSLDVPIKENISIGARVDGEWRHNSRGVNAMVALRVSW